MVLKTKLIGMTNIKLRIIYFIIVSKNYISDKLEFSL